jgi:hypothetical protein
VKVSANIDIFFYSTKDFGKISYFSFSQVGKPRGFMGNDCSPTSFLLWSDCSPTAERTGVFCGLDCSRLRSGLAAIAVWGAGKPQKGGWDSRDCPACRTNGKGEDVDIYLVKTPEPHAPFSLTDLKKALNKSIKT